MIAGLLLPLPSLAGELWDTTAYKKYDQKLIVSYYQSFRRFDFDLVAKSPALLNKGRMLYRADAAVVSGIDLTWDKLSLSLDLNTTPVDSASLRRLGKTNYFNLFFGFGSNRMLMEFSVRSFEGFYERNTAQYTPGFDPKTDAFYQDPNLINRVFRARMLYFFNATRFSYRAAYSCNYRQLKSAASLLLTGNVYHAHFHSNKGIIPPLLRQQNPFGDRYRGSTVIGYNAGLGFAFNLVILKGWFFNGTFWLGPDLHLSQLHLEERGNLDPELTFFGETRLATGFNLKNFYFTLSSKSDILSVSDRYYYITNSFVSAQVALGFRIPVRSGKAVRRIQNNRIYKML